MKADRGEERVRQIEERFISAVGDATQVWLPVLDKSLLVISQNLPLTEKEVRRTLVDKGLIRGEFSVSGLLRLAEVFDREHELEFDPDKSLVASPTFMENIPAVLNSALSMTTHWGATNLQLLSEELATKNVILDKASLIKILNLRSDIVWLDYKEKWFWIKGAQKNRILNYVTKIMSVAGSINVSELRNGTGRWHRTHGYRLPKQILVAFCLSTGLYKLEGDRLIGDERLPDWRKILGPNERKIAEILFRNNYIMRRADLEEATKRAGVSRESFYVLIGYSPVIERYALGVYGLRGAPVTAAQIEAIIPPIQRTSRIFKDNGWTQDGRLWLGYKVSNASATSGVIGVPSSLGKYISGSYRLYTDSDLAVGTLTIRNSNLWGLSPFFRRWNIEGGDYIVIEFDSHNRKAIVLSGDKELITKYQEQVEEPAIANSP